MKKNILTRIRMELYQRILKDSQKDYRSISSFVALLLEDHYEKKYGKSKNSKK